MKERKKRGNKHLFHDIKNGFVSLITSDDLRVQKLHRVFLPKLTVHRNKKKTFTHFNFSNICVLGLYLH